VDIAYTGLRPGEKLLEELSVAGEAYEQTVHSKIFAYRNGPEGTDSNGVARLDWAQLAGQVATLIAAAERGDRADIRLRLQELVPEYQPIAEES
jgi:FlaA1/EpsC-like NDP-sugar epimerase